MLQCCLTTCAVQFQKRMRFPLAPGNQGHPPESGGMLSFLASNFKLDASRSKFSNGAPVYSSYEHGAHPPSRSVRIAWSTAAGGKRLQATGACCCWRCWRRRKVGFGSWTGVLLSDCTWPLGIESPIVRGADSCVRVRVRVLVCLCVCMSVSQCLRVSMSCV